MSTATANPLLSATQLSEKIQQGETTATQLTQAALAAIKEKDGEYNSVLATTEDLALKTADAVDAKAKTGDTLPLLAGVPIAVKDNINVAGYATTCASKILEGFASPYNATVVDKLLANHMPIVGKTNLDEFAMGSSNENSAYGPVKNPVNPEYVPGGSSGGSAATVAAGFVAASLGSDTGGSVRQPASLCGLVGLKPTYGTVSRYGLVAFGSSLDQVSPFTTTVKDAAAVYQVIRGVDANDATMRPDTPTTDYLAELAAMAGKDLSDVTIGVLQELDGEHGQSKGAIAPDVQSAMTRAIETFKSLGATIKTVSIPSVAYAVPAYYILATAEASSNLGRYDGIRYGARKQADTLHPTYKKTRSEGFGAEVKRRIMLGTFCLSAGYYDAFYGKAQQARRLMTKEFVDTFGGGVDAIICPTSPTTAFKLGEKCDDPVAMYLSDIATIPANLAGIPAMSIPNGTDANGLPIGLQLLGTHLSESTLFRIAQAYEQAD